MDSIETIRSTLFSDSALLANYRFEAGALTTDSTSNANTLTNNGTVAESTSGKFGGCADFGSSNSSKSFSRTDNYGLTVNQARTVLGWIKIPAELSGADTYYWIHAFAYGTEKVNYEFWYERETSVNSLCIRRNRASTGNEQLKFTVSIGTGWNQVGYTLSGTTLSLYLNGKKVGTVTANTGNGSSAVTTRSEFGYSTFRAGGYFSGVMDDFDIANRALSPEEIRQRYEGRILGEQDTTNTPSGLWHLNGHSYDYSGNDYNGTDTAISYSLANGKLDQGAGFARGSSSKIVLPNVSNLKPTSAITIMTWYKTTNTTNRQVIWSSSEYIASKQSGILLDISTNADGKLRLVSGRETGTVADTDYKVLDDTISSADGKWHHVAITQDATTLNIYRDGNLTATTSWTFAIGYYATPHITIGAGYYSGAYIDFMDGALDEFSTYPTALTATQVRTAYTTTKQKYFPQLQAINKLSTY